MRFLLRSIVPLFLAGITAGVCAQTASAPAGWPRSLPLPPA